MPRMAIFSRRLQVTGDVKTKRFYACVQHSRWLERPILHFVAMKDTPMEEEPAPRHTPCDFCHEEGH